MEATKRSHDGYHRDLHEHDTDITYNLHRPRGSSGTAKAGLATGITGAALGVINLLAEGGGLFGRRRGYYDYEEAPRRRRNHDENEHHGCCNKYVTHEEMCLIRENIALSQKLAIEEANKFTLIQVEKIEEKLEAKIGHLKDAVVKLDGALVLESERRISGDEKILCYVDGNFLRFDKPSAKSILRLKTCRCGGKYCGECNPQNNDDQHHE